MNTQLRPNTPGTSGIEALLLETTPLTVSEALAVKIRELEESYKVSWFARHMFLQVCTDLQINLSEEMKGALDTMDASSQPETYMLVIPEDARLHVFKVYTDRLNAA